ALTVERPGDIEDAVADEEAPIEGIDLHLTERQILSVEVRDVVGHVSSSRAWGLDVGRCRFYPPSPAAKSACAAGRLDAARCTGSDPGSAALMARRLVEMLDPSAGAINGKGLPSRMGPTGTPRRAIPRDGQTAAGAVRSSRFSEPWWTPFVSARLFVEATSVPF